MKIQEYLIRDVLKFVGTNSWASALSLQGAIMHQFGIMDSDKSKELAKIVLDLQPNAVQKIIRIPTIKLTKPRSGTSSEVASEIKTL